MRILPFTVSTASWLSRRNKQRQWSILSSSIASAASKEEKKEEKKGGDKKKKYEGDPSTKARTENLEKFMQTAEKAKRYVFFCFSHIHFPHPIYPFIQ